jgi:hypothetical protein
MTAARLTWAKHPTGTFHVHPASDAFSLCGIRPRGSVLAPGRPSGRTCKRCRRSLRGRVERSAQAAAALEPRFPNRRTGAEVYLKGLRESVELRVPLSVLDWPGARVFVAEAEAELAAELLAWEATGSVQAAREVEDAGRGLLAAYLRAAQGYADQIRPVRPPRPWEGDP